MMRSVALPSSSSFLVESNGTDPLLLLLQSPRSVAVASARVGSSTICCSSRNNAYIPKLEPFSRSKLDRVLKDPPLIQKTENELADYCSTLEGDPSYGCWRAYFELKDLERESEKAELEKIIIQAGGVISLISCLHGISEIHRKKKEEGNGSTNSLYGGKGSEKPFHVPDGLPPSAEELEEEERAKMPDSAFTRLLRNKGRFPAWYSPAPDHETD
ncbi:CCG-binding protein 1 [Sarracenia purpurea var. burkii]